ncbi:MAG: UDP-N-acetylmuramoyl-L-alanyl-D-glutamate--2,6-diaminopimelate ligase, partial [Ruminococcus sp.]|nr:UDP-N-acetylmuramoyl-L-alanyl-D-glutamate--2,6-diaminopimelate ligase [Ruminococcus sp.]
VDAVVMEVSSHSLALDRVASCEFDVGAFTNVTQDHLDFHETMENYIEAKSQLFKMCRVGVLNHDDAAYDTMKKAAECEVLDYGIKSECGIIARNVEYKSNGVKFDLSYKGKTVNIELAIPGGFSVYNALTAAGCCIGAGLSLEQIAKGLGNASGVKGRIEVVKTDTDYTVIIDYAHTPDGLLNILNAIREFAKGRIITLFGCGGDRDRTKRPLMGKIAAELSDFCIITSDNPRSEEPAAIIDAPVAE